MASSVDPYQLLDPFSSNTGSGSSNFLTDFLIGIPVLGSIFSGIFGGDGGASAASQAQAQAAYAGIQEAHNQFSELQRLLDPYVQAGKTALNRTFNLLGLGDISGYEGGTSFDLNPYDFRRGTSPGSENLLTVPVGEDFSGKGPQLHPGDKITDPSTGAQYEVASIDPTTGSPLQLRQISGQGLQAPSEQKYIGQGLTNEFRQAVADNPAIFRIAGGKSGFDSIDQVPTDPQQLIQMVGGIDNYNKLIRKLGFGEKNITESQYGPSEITPEQQAAYNDALNKVVTPGVNDYTFGTNADINKLKQEQALQSIENSPLFQQSMDIGRREVLANAAATGDYGGNVAQDLGLLGPRVLTSLVDREIGQLNPFLNLGQSSAAGVGAAGLQTAGTVADLYGQQGAAAAGGYLSQPPPWWQAPLNYATQLGNIALASKLF